MNISSPSPARPYHFSTCLVCGAAALEADSAENTVAYQCYRCGGYYITAAAIVVMNKMTPKMRAA